MAGKQTYNYPQGIGAQHGQVARWARYSNLLALLFWSAILLFAIVGTFGGQPHPVVTSQSDIATLEIAMPQRIRNGEFFEIRIDIVAKQGIGETTLDLSQGYFKDLTINTMMPAPEKEEATDGRFRFSFGPLQPGETLHVKIDGQINPPLFAGNKGEIALYDGERRITAIPVQMQVWP